MKTTVIYHSADFDGIFCREIARKFLGDIDVEYIGWNFGDPQIPYPDEGMVYVMDLSPECLVGLPHRAVETLTWIDHHKTSIEKWPKDIPGYRIDGVAACRLAWQWFTMVDGNAKREGAEMGIPIRPAGVLPMIQDYKNREVNEPLAVCLAGEYDIWDKRDPRAETLQYGLRVHREINWSELLRSVLNSPRYLRDLLDDGEIAQAYAQLTDASICQSRTWIMEWEGLKFLCVNSARFNSLFFAARDIPETGNDALLGFCFDGRQWTVSLYHAKHRTDIDLTEIAKKHGGGGHKGACGFTCKTLPFQLT